MLGLSKQLYHGAHRQEEPSLDSGEFEKSILLAKRECRRVFRIDDDTGGGSHLPPVLQSPMEYIHQQRGAEPFSDATQLWLHLPRVVKFCPNAFWWIIVSGRLTQLSSRLTAVQGFQFSLELMRDKAVRAARDARKIRNAGGYRLRTCPRCSRKETSMASESKDLPVFLDIIS